MYNLVIEYKEYYMKKREKVKKRKKRKIIKAPRVQTIFCLVSLAFILGCCVFYGIRLVKYYKIYNPKLETGEVLENLASNIISTSQIVYEGDGLYLNNGNYIYKGENVNNYILINNLLFRIIRINSDRTIEVVLDEYINEMPYGEFVTFSESEIIEYLEEKFLPIFDSDILANTSICNDVITNVSEITCQDIDNNHSVRILGITDFLNSIESEKSYLVNDTENFWLYNQSEDSVWHTSTLNITSGDPSDFYGIRPVLTLKNSTALISGDGSSNNPYQIKKSSSEIKVGTYLDLNDDIYIVYEVGDDYLKVASNKVLKDRRIFDESSNEYANSSLKEYLESAYLDSLSYQALLKEVDFQDVSSKVGILSLDDLKFNSSLENYFLLDRSDDNIYLYNSSLITSSISTRRNVRPCLGLVKDLKIISGNGSKLAPFIVEVPNA